MTTIFINGPNFFKKSPNVYDILPNRSVPKKRRVQTAPLSIWPKRPASHENSDNTTIKYKTFTKLKEVMGGLVCHGD